MTTEFAAVVLGPVWAAVIGVPWLTTRAAEAQIVTTDPKAGPTGMSPAARRIVQGAALVEGTIRNVTFSYDEVSGPRTNMQFLVEKVHGGAVPSDEIKLSTFGGLLPDGRFITTSETPVFADGQRCLLLLTNQSAFWSPIVPDYGFAIERVEGKDILIGDDGRALTSIGVLGPRFGTEVLFEGPRFDGTHFQPSTRLDAPATTRGMTVADAASAIMTVARADEVRLGGDLGSSQPPWSPWNAVPVAGVAQ